MADKRRANWDFMFNQLVEFKKVSGHCNVPRKYLKNPRLGLWVGTQRTQKGKLPRGRISRLNRIGFEWNLYSSAWEEMFSQLLAFKKENGHCNVPNQVSEYRQLRDWVSNQRSRKDNLNPGYKNRLEKLEFDWTPRSSLWEELFQRLIRFKMAENHCNVPATFPQDQRLSNWVKRQRQVKETSNPARIRRLDNLGLDWEPVLSSWEGMFAELIEFKKAYGHCDVPQKFQENVQLAAWARTQRSYKKSLSSEKIARLNKIGYDWAPMESRWEGMFTELFAYKKAHGDCNVPRGYPKNVQLATWVGVQRQKKLKLSSDRVRRLNGLGFKWRMR